MEAVTQPVDYEGAGRRLYEDADTLYQAQRVATATHLFGLAAECALKACMNNVPGGDRDIPHKHLPELLDDAKLWLNHRRRSHLWNVISHLDYMRGWRIANRYWPDEHFTVDHCGLCKRHARQAIVAIDGGV